MKLKNLLVVMLFAALVVLAACGGSSSSAAPAPTGASVVTLGDAAADNIVSFEITISDIKLVNSGGVAVDVPGTHRLEMTHLSATVEDLSHLTIPAGTYTSATIAWSAPEVSFFDDLGVLHEIDSAATGTATVPLANLTVSGATVFNFDIDVAASVALTTAAPVAATFTPTFSFTAARGVGEAEREPEDGALEHVIGSVVTASATSLTINVGQAGSTLTFVVNANTSFEAPMTSASQLVAKQIVRVEGDVQADGTMIAKEIEAESADGNGTEAEGLVTTKGVSSFTMIAHDASGASTSSADLGKTVTVDASVAKFTISKTKINSGNLSFSAFADLAVGQHVEADSDAAKSAGAGSVSDDGAFGQVKKIKLVQQALTGTVSVSGAPGANFTLTLPATSAFATLTGATTVQVVNNGAQLKNIATFTAGGKVRVRGLLFHDAGGYHMAAGRITTP